MIRNEWRDYFENILVAVFLALFVRTFILTGYKVPTSSMAPNLLPGDFIFSYRIPYGFKIPLTQMKIGERPPQRGEVVVFTFPEQPRVSYVKRIIGLPGDRIEMINNELVVNGNRFSYQPIEVDEELRSVYSDTFRIMEELAPQGKYRILLKNQATEKKFGPLIVPQDEVFLLGDNRDASDDSRYWGTVPISRIEGKVKIIWLSLDWNKRWAQNLMPQVRTWRIFTVVN